MRLTFPIDRGTQEDMTFWQIFWQRVDDISRRVLWGRTRAESEALAMREAFQRAVREGRREGICLIVHAPEIWGGYCEVHKSGVWEGHPCRTNKETNK